MNEYFEKTFNESNGYTLKKPKFYKQEPIKKNFDHHGNYLRTIARSRFVICPPGIGFDTYRMWEVIALGSIPVVENSIGLPKSFSLLPVLVVHDLLTITPQFLESTYDCFYQHADKVRVQDVYECECVRVCAYDRVYYHTLVRVTVSHRQSVELD